MKLTVNRKIPNNSWLPLIASAGGVLFPGLVIPVLTVFMIMTLPNAFAHIRLRLSRSKSWVLLLLGTFLFHLPSFIHYGISKASLKDPLQTILLLIIILAFTILPANYKTRIWPAVSLGVLTGLAIIALISILQVSGLLGLFFDLFSLDTISLLENLRKASQDATLSTRASGWLVHPNLWAVTIILPSLFLFTSNHKTTFALISILPAVIVVGATGSRTAAMAYLLSVTLMLFNSRLLADLPRKGLVVLAMLILVITVATSGDNVWLMRFRLPAISEPHRTSDQSNLFKSSEVLTFAAWSQLQVRVQPDIANIFPTTSKRIWRIQKTGDSWWARVQQSITLVPKAVYVLSAELQSLTPEATIGLHGIGRSEIDYAFLKLSRQESTWYTEGDGALEVLSFNIDPLARNWTKTTVTFAYRGQSPLDFNVGPTPDQRNLNSGATLRVRGLQISEGATNSVYFPTYPTGTDSRTSFGSVHGRLEYFSEAWHGFTQKPLLGWGLNTFGEFYAAPGKNHPYVVAHAHNLFLQTLFERGLVGTAGLLTLLLGMFFLTAKHNRKVLIVILAVIAANLTDYTFWSSSIAYPLAIIVGWYAKSPDTLEEGAEGAERTREVG